MLMLMTNKRLKRLLRNPQKLTFKVVNSWGVGRDEELAVGDVQTVNAAWEKWKLLPNEKVTHDLSEAQFEFIVQRSTC